MWYQIVNLGGRERKYLETSGTSVMAYAIFKGIRLGLLPEEYRSRGEMAFNGICEKYLTEVDGDLNLGGICLVAGLGGAGALGATAPTTTICPSPSSKTTPRASRPFCLHTSSFCAARWGSNPVIDKQGLSMRERTLGGQRLKTRGFPGGAGTRLINFLRSLRSATKIIASPTYTPLRLIENPNDLWPFGGYEGLPIF
jgi:hypothetical protein